MPGDGLARNEDVEVGAHPQGPIPVEGLRQGHALERRRRISGAGQQIEHPRKFLGEQGVAEGVDPREPVERPAKSPGMQGGSEGAQVVMDQRVDLVYRGPLEDPVPAERHRQERAGLLDERRREASPREERMSRSSGDKTKRSRSALSR